MSMTVVRARRLPCSTNPRLMVMINEVHGGRAGGVQL